MKIYLPILLLLPVFINGQSHFDGWKAHVSFTPVICVAETPQSIVAATSGGIFLVGKEGFQITTKTKVEGLSEVGITAVAYSANSNILLVGYENGNLDLLQNERIVNFPDLTRKADLPDKTIHRIVCEGNIAYLCCAFGIVKIDLQKAEASETWYLGPSNDLRSAFDLASFGGNWWVATDRGIFKSAKLGTNLQDYRNWQLQTTLPQSDAAFSSFAQSDGLLFTHDRGNDRILSFNGTNWQQQFPGIKNIRGIRSHATGLIVLSANEVLLTGKTGNTLINSYSSGSGSAGIDPRDALAGSNGELWIADHRFGLTRRKATSSFQHFLPDSPGSDQISALKAGPDAIFAATVTTNEAGLPEAGISILQAGIWQNFSAADDPGLKSVKPFTSLVINMDKPDEYWASSAGSGLFFFQKNRVSAIYNEFNSGLGGVSGSCVVNGLASDAQGNLWYTNPTGKARLGTRSADGSFLPLPYPGMGFSASPTGAIIVTGSSAKWAVLPDDGLFAFKIKGTTANISDDQYRKVAVQSRFSNASTTLITQFSGISAIAEDNSNQLWVGTSTGVVVYDNPDKVFDPGEFYSIQPSLDDRDGLFKPILAKEKITAIAIDGGNRKWIGTARSGVFLFSEQGDHLLQHFDSNHSPLPSDQIHSIAIVPKSGDVLFATDRGLVSYRSDATAGRKSFDTAYAWPNPVRESFSGNVTIDGLADGTDVRITDVAGMLIYRTTSLGGRAVWNVKNAGGSRVATGVYLIFCSSHQTKDTKIIKLLVIH